MYTYRWNGHDGIELTGVGIVNNGQVFTTDHEVNNEDAVVVVDTPHIEPRPQEQPATEQENISANADVSIE